MLNYHPSNFRFDILSISINVSILLWFIVETRNNALVFNFHIFSGKKVIIDTFVR